MLLKVKEKNDRTINIEVPISIMELLKLDKYRFVQAETNGEQLTISSMEK